MSDILAIVEQADGDEQLLEEIARRHPDKVTVLVEGNPTAWLEDEQPRDRALRDRLRRLCAAIEQRTGAVVVGLTPNRERLRGWRFDRVVSSRGALSLG